MEKNRVYISHENNFKLRKIVYYIIGILETLFVFRLIFKLLGANPGNTLVSLIYTVSGTFLAPFSGIFRATVNQGIETGPVIAMIVYAFISYGVVRLIQIYGITKYKEI